MNNRTSLGHSAPVTPSRYWSCWRLHIIANFCWLRLFPVIKLRNPSRPLAVQTVGGYGGPQSTTSLAKW